MNIVVLTDYYHPIIKSGSIIVGDLVDELVLQGHQLTVITFVNNQKHFVQCAVEGNLEIIRIRSLTRGYGKVGRLWAEYNYSKKVIKNLKKNQNINYDAIICYSPSIFYGTAVRWIKTRYKIKAYIIVRDIFPKWALDSGILSDGLLYKYFKFIERNLYSSANIIGIESKADLKYFQNYGLELKIQIEVLNNWAIKKILVKKNLPIEITLDETKINIVYGGNMGDAQDLFSVISSIDISILEKRAVIYLIGNGNQFYKIKKFIQTKKISNIIILPPIERDQYLTLMSKADIGLVSLSKKMLSNNYPLKMIGYMQLGKPILASVNQNNEVIKMFNEHNIGLVSIASDKVNFNRNLNEIISSKVNRKVQSKNALKLFNRKFTAEAAALQISNHFL